ncbi:UxaA family hydrolase [Thermasporomyces composti]|jgi:altronate hydrolase|uniref:Altronate hydrolase n=1 Tax=Thermasporomyces composti TaxID=696763 RepID=A0A3D9VI36_THECX|nr:altronate dehydratase family protein [Thermasporomyces composti]REF37874.1 altronate hydrolase [Thermasporomyces composti]
MDAPTLAEHTLRLHADDNVVIAMRDIEPGTYQLPGGGTLDVTDVIPRGHKLAVTPVAEGQPVRKYGQVIGFAKEAIAPGRHVHTHNTAFQMFDREYEFGVDTRPTQYVPETARATFQGIVRPDGRAATRNYIGILTTVNCSATAAKLIAERFRWDALDDYPNVDGVVALTHGTGCGMAGPGSESFEVLRRTLTGYANHPNFAGFLVLGLGCEVNQVSTLVEHWQIPEHKITVPMTIQELGGTRKTVAEGVARIKEMLPDVNKVTRETVPASELILAMECGGSDAYSGITANPALGAAADLLVQHGGTAVFGETPEIYGAEHLLARRAVSREVGEKLIARIRWWEEYTAKHGGSMDNNPSPGNKAGGLTTILEKSLGAAAKGGTTNLVDVVEFAEPVTAKGLVFMDTPGYDPVNATGMVAGGAQVLCFTTGRGSAFGCKPTPSIKLATNTPVYERMIDDMDYNCGLIADGGMSVEEAGREIFELVLRVASGAKTKSEELGYGDEEFVPWQLGAVM